MDKIENLRGMYTDYLRRHVEALRESSALLNTAAQLDASTEPARYLQQIGDIARMVENNLEEARIVAAKLEAIEALCEH